MVRALWTDCDGGVITTELVLVASFVTATLLAGLGTLKTKLGSEFNHLATSVENARNRVRPSLQAIDSETDEALPGVTFGGPLESFAMDSVDKL